MELKASVLYEALKELGKLPKTLKIERITIKTDSVTGTKHKETISSDHAMVGVQCDGRTATVDFDKLKKFSNIMKTAELSVRLDGRCLEITYPQGSFYLLHNDVKAPATLDLNRLAELVSQ